MKRLISILILANVCFIILAFFVHVPLPFDLWRKGPPIHAASAYTSGNASKIFWVATSGLVDIYFLLIFIAHYKLFRKKLFSQKWFYSLLILAIAMVSFCVTEYATRFYIQHSRYFTQFRPHPILYWWNRPNLKDYIGRSDPAPKSTNAMGFRYYTDIAYDKPEGEYRIFVIGDSSTFGHGVRDDETFSSHLERMLNSKLDCPVRVINAACPGHTMYQNLLTLNEYIIQFSPDAVIIANNDDHAMEYVEDMSRACTNPYINKLKEFLYRSDYYLLFQRVAMDCKIYLLNALKFIPKPSLVRRVSLKDYKKNTRSIIDSACNSNAWPIFVKMPINITTLDHFPDLKQIIYDARYPKTLSQICLDKDVFLVDVDGRWNGREEGLYERFSYEGHKLNAPYHPSAQGHLLIAEQICNEMLAFKTHLTFFVPSDRQNAFDSLKNGYVSNSLANHFTVIFDIDTEDISNMDTFVDGDLVRVFYKKGKRTLKAIEIVPIDCYGYFEKQDGPLSIDHYIEGRFSKDRSALEVLFNTRDSLTYVPESVTVKDRVNIVYSESYMKPPLARRIVKTRNDKTAIGVSSSKESFSAISDDQIEQMFYDGWLRSGESLWGHIAHKNFRFRSKYRKAQELFQTVQKEVAGHFGVTEDMIMGAIRSEDYIQH